MATSLARIPQLAADLNAPIQPFDPTAMPDQPMAKVPASMEAVQPAVTRAQTPGEQQIAYDQAKLQKFQHQDADPWGSPDNHPGKLGKIAHVFSTLGNIAGDIFAPAVMARIPGTQLNRQVQEGQLANEIKGTEQAESENAYRGAEQAKTEEATREEAPNDESRRELEGAQTAEAQDKVNNPDLATAYAHRVNQVLREGGDPATDPTVMHLQDAITSIQRQATPKDDQTKTADILGPDHKEHVMGWDSKTNKYDVDMGLKGEKPTQAPGITMVVPGANGTQTIQRLTPGQTVAPGSMTTSQFGGGSAADVKQGKAEQQQTQNLDSELNLMKQFAANPSPTNDAAMLMHYIGATKPESMGKIRLNERELTLFGGTRSSLGDAEALLTKVANGQSLTPQQRTDMVNTMTMIDHAAKRGNGGESGGSGAPPPGAKVRDYTQLGGH